MSKRLKFPGKGLQRNFIIKCKDGGRMSWDAMAKFLKISRRTITDWKREKFLMSLAAARNLSKRSGVVLSKGVEIKNEFWYTSSAGRLGGQAVYKKYGRIGGNPDLQKKSWRKWWNAEGRYIKREIFKRRTIRIPKFNNQLAEFFGVMIGDGGLSNRQLFITLNRRDDYEYAIYVRRLIQKLFGLKPSIRFRKSSNALDIVVSSVNLVEFCNKLGLKIGDKIRQRVNVPVWIRRRSSWQIACLRGLFDTDGSIFRHCYSVRGKRYCYPKLQFSSAAPTLLKSVHQMLQGLGFKSRIDYSSRGVYIEDKTVIKRFYKIIGTSNPKRKGKFLR